MFKIVQAINSMISNAEKITNVSTYGNDNGEFYFTYDNKYVWGIRQPEDEDIYYLYFYPEIQDQKELKNVKNWNKVPCIDYSTNELKTREALESFRELYLIVKEKTFGVENILDEIIGNK